MRALESEPKPLSKGERTAQRLLDAAERQFAQRGYEASSLRDIASQAGIREPGVYNHFKGKQGLYEAVLERALAPMVETLDDHLSSAEGIRAYASLPAVMTDLLLEHPQMAALFQQALQGDPESVGNQMIKRWLDRLFEQGAAIVRAAGVDEVDPADLALQTIAMFNLTTGYFLSQRAFELMAEGQVTDPEVVTRQKKLLGRIQRALLLG